jgi:uncharacterized protein
MMPYRFLLDSTLGKLCRQLRMAGFDCRYDDGIPDARRLRAISAKEARIILTRARRVGRRLADERVVLVRDNDPGAQMQQVVRHLGIDRGDLRPMSRCLRCNLALIEIPKESLTGRVPEYVLHHHATFRGCRLCGRIYWPGSHAQRMQARLAGWFDEAQEG